MSNASIQSSSFGKPETLSRRDEYRLADDAPFPGTVLA
jgi:hypothetical protein